MSSGLIYAVIVALWAVVLVPMWLRRHDEVTESRSVDRFQGAMRTLSRRESAAGDQREVLVPRRNATRAVPDGAASQLSVAAVAAERRRRTTVVLAGLTVLLLGLSKLRGVPLWTAVLPLVLLLAFVGQATLSARRTRARDLAERRARAVRMRRDHVEAARQAMPVTRSASDEVYDDRRVLAPAAGAAVATARTVVAPLSVPLPVPVPVPVPVVAPVAAEFFDAQAEPVWDPVPVPVPTYVSAPKAVRSVRVIDLTKPGAWTSGHLDADEAAAYAEQAAERAEELRAADPDGIVTGEVLIQRRAVGH